MLSEEGAGEEVGGESRRELELELEVHVVRGLQHAYVDPSRRKTRMDTPKAAAVYAQPSRCCVAYSDRDRDGGRARACAVRAKRSCAQLGGATRMRTAMRTDCGHRRGDSPWRRQLVAWFFCLFLFVFAGDGAGAEDTCMTIILESSCKLKQCDMIHAGDLSFRKRLEAAEG